jgi:meiosis-specific transcription factor NDT80
MSPPSHSQGTSHSTQSLLGGPGRDSYPPPLNHAPPRIPFSGHPNVHESMSRPSYPPRAVENPVTSTYSPTALYSHQNNAMMLDATGRQDQSASGAPPFGATQEHCLIYNSNRDKVKPDIQARIHKGFFKVDDKWTCYRRNYFSVQCSFSLLPPQVNSQLYVHRSTSSGLEPIQSFVVTISAVVNGNGVDGDTRALIQHTPKRSKETEEAPKKIRINPIPPNHGLNQNGTSGSMPYSFGGLPQLNGTKQDYDTTYGSGNQGSQNSTSHTFERIQFQRATANNGKRRAQQQYYHVVVELYAEVARSSDTSAFGTLLKIATKLSAPMVVRGRSPGHYKDGRRDSSTSGMGGDGPSGPGDGGGGSILPPSMSGPGHINRYSLPSDQSGSHIGRGDYRGVQGVSFTTSPEDHSSSSSGGLEQDSMEDEDDPMDTSEVDRYIQNEYQAGPEVDLHGNATPMNGYRFQLPPVDFTRPPIDSINEANASFNIPFFSSNPHSARHQTPRPGERYPRHEYTHSPERPSHAPWQTNGYPRAPFAAAGSDGSDGWNGNPYARFEAVNSA